MIRTIAVIAVVSALTACSQTSSTGTRMEMRGYAFPPPGFMSFCSAEPDLCSTLGEDAPVKLTAARRAELNEVNLSINRSIEQRNDRPRGGQIDDWRMALTQGDCEDIAIRKKSELMARGWPASSLLLTVGWFGREGHTVLTVRTSDGDLVLDSRTDRIRDWSRTPYRYFARQAPGKGDAWLRIGKAEQVASAEI